MANPTTNYSFAMPTNTDLVKDLPADFEVFGQAVDTQMKTNADAAIAKSLVTTKGDLIAATGASTPARLGVGTNGQVLTADSAEASGVKWATAASGGITLLSTTTLSGNSVTVSSISQNYKNLIIDFQAVYANSNNGYALNMRINSDTGGNYATRQWETGGYANYTTSYISLVNELSSTSTAGYAIYTLPDYTNTTHYKTIDGYSMMQAPANDVGFTGMVGSYKSTSAVTSLTFYVASASFNFSGGTVRIYGVS